MVNYNTTQINQPTNQPNNSESSYTPCWRQMVSPYQASVLVPDAIHRTHRPRTQVWVVSLKPQDREDFLLWRSYRTHEVYNRTVLPENAEVIVDPLDHTLKVRFCGYISCVLVPADGEFKGGGWSGHKLQSAHFRKEIVMTRDSTIW